jgi:hypothetical protein
MEVVPKSGLARQPAPRKRGSIRSKTEAGGAFPASKFRLKIITRILVENMVNPRLGCVNSEGMAAAWGDSYGAAMFFAARMAARTGSPLQKNVRLRPFFLGD